MLKEEIYSFFLSQNRSVLLNGDLEHPLYLSQKLTVTEESKVQNSRLYVGKASVIIYIPDICHERCERRACKIFG